MSEVTKALALLATESWDTDEPGKREHWRSAAAAAATEHDQTRAEALRVWRVEDLIWDKLAAEGEHGDENLEMRLSLNLFSVMNAVDPDGTTFKKPYKTQPKVLEIEKLRARLKWFEEYHRVAELARVADTVGEPEYGYTDTLELLQDLTRWVRENPEPGAST